MVVRCSHWWKVRSQNFVKHSDSQGGVDRALKGIPDLCAWASMSLKTCISFRESVTFVLASEFKTWIYLLVHFPLWEKMYSLYLPLTVVLRSK